MSEPSDYEDCGCGKCCLPTIIDERDEARAEVERLRDAVEGWEQSATMSVGALHEARKDRNEARAELDRAVELLKERGDPMSIADQGMWWAKVECFLAEHEGGGKR